MWRGCVFALMITGCLGASQPSVDEVQGPDLSIYAECGWLYPDGTLPACAPDTVDGTPLDATPLPNVPEGWFCRLWYDADQGGIQWRLYVRPYEDPKTGQIDPNLVQLGLWWEMPNSSSPMKGALQVLRTDGAPLVTWDGAFRGFVAIPFGAPRVDTLFTAVLLAWPPAPEAANLTIDGIEPFWHLHEHNVAQPRLWPIAEVDSGGTSLFFPVSGTHWDSGDNPSLAGDAHWGTVPDDYSSDERGPGFEFRLRHPGFSIDGHMRNALDPIWLRCSCHLSPVPPLDDPAACLLPPV